MRVLSIQWFTLFGLTATVSSLALAADQMPMPAAHGGMASATMTPELKKDMADMYQKMADCMRTDKTLAQCSNDAMKNCPVVEKTGHCPINEGTRPMGGKRMKSRMSGMGEKGMGDMGDNHPMEGGQ